MGSIVRSWLLIGIVAVALGPGTVAVAQGQGTPDGMTPAVEEVCTGMMGAAYGLCVAFCEANDCDLYPDSQACDTLREKYSKITGEDYFPCEVGEEG